MVQRGRERETILRVGRLLAEEARRRVAQPANLPSRTLRESLFVAQIPGQLRWRLASRYYWATFYHNGRGPVRAQPGKYLVFFVNPEDDPRTGFGRLYPETLAQAQARPLTPEEFAAGMERNRELATPGNPFPFMVVTKSVRGVEGNPFFTRGLQGFDRVAKQIIRQEIGGGLLRRFSARWRRVSRALKDPFEVRI